MTDNQSPEKAGNGPAPARQNTSVRDLGVEQLRAVIDAARSVVAFWDLLDGIPADDPRPLAPDKTEMDRRVNLLRVRVESFGHCNLFPECTPDCTTMHDIVGRTPTAKESLPHPNPPRDVT